MTRLPIPGGDSGNWGDILNTFLSQVHASDGTLKTDSVTSDAIAPDAVTSSALAPNAVDAITIADGSITEALLDTAVQTKLNAVAPVTSVASKTGDVSLTKTDVGLDQVDNTSDATKNAATATLTNKTLVNPVTGMIYSDNVGAPGKGFEIRAGGVNYVAVNGTAAGNPVYLSARGDDTNIALYIQARGDAPVYLRNDKANYLYATGTDTGVAPTLTATGSDTNVNLNLRTRNAGIVQANGVEVVTISGTQTLTNKTISGSSNTITNIPASATPDASRLVVTTAPGGTDTETGANTWAKIATINGGGYGDVNVILAFVCHTATAQHATAIVSFYARYQNTGVAATGSVRILSAGSDDQNVLGFDSFKLIGGITPDPFEIWVQKKQVTKVFKVYELSAAISSGMTLSYTTTPGWQSATPTGTALNAISNGVMAFDAPAVTTTATQTLTNKTLTNSKMNAIYDTAGTPALSITATGGPNYLTLTNSVGNPGFTVNGSSTDVSFFVAPKGAGTLRIYVPSGQTPTLTAAGADANHNLNLVTQGTGVVKANGVEVATVSDTQTLTNKTFGYPTNLGSPKANQINDSNNNLSLVLEAAASAVNYFRLKNSATGNAAIISVAGSDTNINFNLTSKGAGVVQANGNQVVTLVSAPATATSAGETGQIAYDASYVYVCTATNTWTRAALSTW